jgi:C4-dicarboxylate-specific signal transduction histidine kinase
LRLWLTGKTDFDVYSDAVARLAFAEEQAILQTGRPLKEKIEAITLPSGANVWNLVTKMPWRDAQGRLLGTYGIAVNISAMKEAEEKLKAVHEELMQASRLAGMAEVATGVLHNVGNVLNSVNVSATLVREKLQASEVTTLGRVATLLRSHAADLPAYLVHDLKGRLIPGIVVQLAEQLAKENELLRLEHEQLARNVEHIKEIVAMQQSYARVSGVLEKVQLAEVLEDALQINTGGLARHGVEVRRQFTEVPPVTVDKHKVMQILVNLIHNAKYALDASDRSDRHMTLGLKLSGDNRVRVSVADNGVGIPPENLTRIFSRGFTTREHGHGFGLHSGAIAAKEMGGLILAESPGIGLGATFTLELPLGGATTSHE